MKSNISILNFKAFTAFKGLVLASLFLTTLTILPNVAQAGSFGKSFESQEEEEDKIPMPAEKPGTSGAVGMQAIVFSSTNTNSSATLEAGAGLSGEVHILTRFHYEIKIDGDLGYITQTNNTGTPANSDWVGSLRLNTRSNAGDHINLETNHEIVADTQNTRYDLIDIGPGYGKKNSYYLSLLVDPLGLQSDTSGAISNLMWSPSAVVKIEKEFHPGQKDTVKIELKGRAAFLLNNPLTSSTPGVSYVPNYAAGQYDEVAGDPAYSLNLGKYLEVAAKLGYEYKSKNFGLEIYAQGGLTKANISGVQKTADVSDPNNIGEVDSPVALSTTHGSAKIGVKAAF